MTEATGNAFVVGDIVVHANLQGEYIVTALDNPITKLVCVSAYDAVALEACDKNPANKFFSAARRNGYQGWVVCDLLRLVCLDVMVRAAEERRDRETWTRLVHGLPPWIAAGELRDTDLLC